MVDKYGKNWDLPAKELCPICGQPDNCGDCNHKKLTKEQAIEMGATNEQE